MPADPEPQLVPALQATLHRLLVRLARDLRELGLSQGEINALAQLDRATPRTVTELQRATGQRGSTLTGILDRLEARKLVRRDLNPGDRRSFTVALTARGERVAAQVRKTFAAVEREALGGATARSRKGFFEVLERLDSVASDSTLDGK